jgi:hypothetical protein
MSLESFFLGREQAWTTRAAVFLLPLFVLLLGCATVTGRIQPIHFQFTTIVNQRAPSAGGWRAACIHARLKNGTTGDFFFCKFGVEVPIESREGPISIPLAQRIAADCTNEAAYTVLEAASKEPNPPLGLLCESFKTAYRLRMGAAIPGSRVVTMCAPSAKPVMFGELTP